MVEVSGWKRGGAPLSVEGRFVSKVEWVIGGDGVRVCVTV